jgi:integrase
VGHRQHRCEKRFPPDTPIDTLKTWRRRQAEQADQLHPKAAASSFARDVVRFLRNRRSITSFKSDRSHLRVWAHRFRYRSRWHVTADDIRAAVGDWQADGYSPREIRHRVKLLEQLYRTLGGRRAPTPCDEVVLPKVPKTRPIAVSDTLVRDVALELRKHELLGLLRDAKTRARYLVLATTGQRPAQVRRAQPMDVDLERRVWHVRPAKGDNGGIVYLNDDMHAAWSLFVAAKAWGTYDSRSFVKVLHRCGWPKGVRPYNLRHTVGLTLSELGVDLGDIQAHMGHTSPATTRAFYVPAILSRLKAASLQLDERRLLTPITASATRSATQATGGKRTVAEIPKDFERAIEQEKSRSRSPKTSKTA